MAHAEVGGWNWTPLLSACCTMCSTANDIDAAIVGHLKGWALSRNCRVSLVALRLALAEMLRRGGKSPVLP